MKTPTWIALVIALALAACTDSSGGGIPVAFPNSFPLLVATPCDGCTNTWYNVGGLVSGSSYGLNISLQDTTVAASATAYTDLSGDAGSGTLCTASVPSGMKTATCLFTSPASFVYIGVVGSQDKVTLSLSTP
jgi:hypothetical protein